MIASEGGPNTPVTFVFVRESTTKVLRLYFSEQEAQICPFCVQSQMRRGTDRRLGAIDFGLDPDLGPTFWTGYADHNPSDIIKSSGLIIQVNNLAARVRHYDFSRAELIANQGREKTYKCADKLNITICF
ncbi:hypothetical protein FRC19_008621 [Serendipita sp. 401]|nr:hypothetical protein FRC19_008621 [Serendipita sp. 401]KAG9053200.1 hypothetical protein FS842_008528 [Serendipita sp. 407]